MNSLQRTAGALGLNASAGHTRNSQDASGTKLKFGKEKGNLDALWRKEHLRKPHDKQIVPAKQRGTWREKYTSSKPKIKTTFSSRVERKVARNIAYRMFVMDSGASMHNVEQGRLELRYNGYFERVQNPISDLPRPGTVQINK